VSRQLLYALLVRIRHWWSVVGRGYVCSMLTDPMREGREKETSKAKQRKWRSTSRSFRVFRAKKKNTLYTHNPRRVCFSLHLHTQLTHPRGKQPKHTLCSHHQHVFLTAKEGHQSVPTPGTYCEGRCALLPSGEPP
jgi:hypothetical protein